MTEVVSAAVTAPDTGDPLILLPASRGGCIPSNGTRCCGFLQPERSIASRDILIPVIYSASGAPVSGCASPTAARRGTSGRLSGLQRIGLVLAVPRLARVPVHVEHDSATFTNALDRWFPLVYAKTSTPRAIKRFLNRVRFYAMSQRGAASPAPDRPTQIPEDALVALSVMQHAGVGTVDEALGHIALEVDPM